MTPVDISPEAVEDMATHLDDFIAQRANHAANMLRALRSALTAEAKQAARYRWLRDNASTQDLHALSYRSANDIDAAIDAAMEKANG